ncbi:arylsulfatase [Bacteroides sp. 214]|uniref:arylsulfatase n=1 Tax=Bacteroides sp. 214 TaxID=2302935 RepID=UPI0013D531D5|nr:arylsulfatase [Bacteroides sp. 214]NDW12662.1 arylsulfatase [Bacteroides sp. 214]
MEKQKLMSISCGIAGALAAVGCTQQPKATWETSPNVIFILADDLGIGDISPYGQELIKTPNIQRMADEGMRFTQGYSGTSVSAPSRASLMTGQHTGHTYIRGNMRMDPEGQVAMPAGTFTVAQLFHEAGYATGGFGKWGLGYPGSESDPMKVGFDEFLGYNCQTLAHDYYPTHLWDGTTRVEFPENSNGNEVTYAADLIHERALQFIRNNADKPFFAYLPYTLPHAELVLPKDSVYQYYCNVIPAEDDKSWAEENPNRRGAYGATERPLAAFASMVTRLDSYVGDIMDLLAQLGIDKNTIVIFTSDNGPHREGGANPDYFKSYGDFRGVKRDLYEGGIRMPMIIRCPNHIEAGTTNDHIMAFWDMMPTFADLIDCKEPIQTDGISFLPTLLGKKGQKEHDYLYWEFHEKGGKQAVRYQNWKAVKLNVGIPDQTIFELYNLSDDIHEDHNVANQHPEIVKKIEDMMKNTRTESELFNFSRM